MSAANPQYKRCYRCKETKAVSEFHKDRSRYDGIRPLCKACISDDTKRKYWSDRENKLAMNRQWFMDNAEYRSEYNFARRGLHADLTRAWREANKEQANVHARISASHRRARKREAIGSHTFDELWAMAESQNWVCAYCEAPLFGEFQADHMTPLCRGGSNDWSNIAITCISCNATKRHRTAEEFVRTPYFRNL